MKIRSIGQNEEFCYNYILFINFCFVREFTSIEIDSNRNLLSLDSESESTISRKEERKRKFEKGNNLSWRDSREWGKFLRRKMEVVMQLVFHIICFIASPSVDFVFAPQLLLGSFLWNYFQGVLGLRTFNFSFFGHFDLAKIMEKYLIVISFYFFFLDGEL